MEELKAGLVGQVRQMIEERHTVQHFRGGNMPVLATPVMIALMEEAATEAVDHLLPKGQQTVGIHLEVQHMAPTPIGMEVIARAELIDIDGRILTFHMTAEDEDERIGEGTHKRAIIDVAQFQDRITQKQAG